MVTLLNGERGLDLVQLLVLSSLSRFVQNNGYMQESQLVWSILCLLLCNVSL